VRVVVADDVMLTREGIAVVLAEAGVDVVAQATDADSLLHEVLLHAPDAVVVDIRMPPTYTDEGLVAVGTIRRHRPQTAVLVLSQYVDPGYALRLVDDRPEGVGYLLKDRLFEGAVLVDALRRLVEGETVIDPTIVSRLLGRRRPNDPIESLTAREREVLALVAEGLSNRGIADHLHIAERTVETHITQTFDKLGLTVEPHSHRRVQATLLFLRRSP
jgi:DNA-binding NarL/FixJ family response regulator